MKTKTNADSDATAVEAKTVVASDIGAGVGGSAAETVETAIIMIIITAKSLVICIASMIDSSGGGNRVIRKLDFIGENVFEYNGQWREKIVTARNFEITFGRCDVGGTQLSLGHYWSSIPFSVDDLSKSMDQTNIADIEPPPFIRDNSGFSFLLSRAES
ncbi:hypothetical protein L1987_83955 [Smallanthus sonchifolius]|uniref:Uncharacterized protein n=1 Tax=Smallanthus sonchifolius TaxID=185202 RepID=A0ACB8YE17_9ASTR|nr:hypothetical protein L1987_83955 [Smallanthus sonchifolius]